MQPRKLASFWLLAPVVLLMLGALYQLNSSSPDLETSAPATTETIRLTVSAAASLQTAMEALDPTFASAHPTIEVNYNFAASGTLQRQIEQGATVDLFISAAPKHMDALQGKNLILKDTRRNLLSNSLVLVVPQDSTLKIREFRQLTDPAVKRISLGEPRSVPAGQYGVEVFTNLGILPQLKPKFVYGNSVRNVLSTVESGNADAGIVYATDAQISAQVTTVTTAPADLHTPIVYPIAVMAASVHPEAAQIYSKFLTSKAAQNVFSQYGFSPSE